jgi:hypothetical protein
MVEQVAERSFDGFRLSCFGSQTTGVAGTIIWASVGEPVDAEDLGPRLWVVLGDAIRPQGLVDAASVRLTIPPEVLGELPEAVRTQAVKFVRKNRIALLRHWKGGIDSKEMCDLLVRV